DHGGGLGEVGTGTGDVHDEGAVAHGGGSPCCGVGGRRPCWHRPVLRPSRWPVGPLTSDARPAGRPGTVRRGAAGPRCRPGPVRPPTRRTAAPRPWRGTRGGSGRPPTPAVWPGSPPTTRGQGPPRTSSRRPPR